MEFKFYPAIDIRGGRVVRLVQGDYKHEIDYNITPLEAVGRWLDGGTTSLHIVDLDGAREGKPINEEAISELVKLAKANDTYVQLGGGLRSLGDLETADSWGVSKFVIGTAAFTDPEFLGLALENFPQRVIVPVDAKDGEVKISGWQQSGATSDESAAANLIDRGVKNFIYSSISKDGTMSGPDIESAQRFNSAISGRATFIYAGGISSVEDVGELIKAKLSSLTGVISGRAMYEERFSVSSMRAQIKEYQRINGNDL